MSKEWILNSVMNRFQLNYKRNVGGVAEQIRCCKPKTIKDWENYYYSKVYPKKHLEGLGKRLYKEIKSTISEELDSITEKDCVAYIKDVVIRRTYNGYLNEIETIKQQLQGIISQPIKPALDEWDRLYGVDYFIHIGKNYLGLQFKPERTAEFMVVHQQHGQLMEQHKKFSEKYGGKVFVIVSKKEKDKYIIENEEVVEEIKNEIKRLTA